MTLALSGQTFGRLTVVKRVPSSNKNSKWECVCACGNKVAVQGGHLRNGHTQSCGCLHRETAAALKASHGHTTNRTFSKTYNSWRAMIDRCKPQNVYGKRGITVCERWRVFTNFLEDMGERPAGMEIDRGKGNYTPENCQWLPVSENRGQRSNPTT